MMKNIKRLLAITMCFAVVMGWAMVLGSAGWALGGLGAVAYAADDDEYTYTVTVNAGKEGTLSNGDTSTIKSYKNIPAGGTVTITEADLGLTVKDPSTYFVRGIKISGHDNDETSTRHYQLPVTVSNINEDMSFSVAYGVKGAMIDYTVRYVDADDPDTELYPTETYYGMPGDYLVVSCRYVDDYLPDAYNKGWTLKEDGIRDIVFYLTEKPAGDNGNNPGANNPGANGGAAANNGNAGNAGAPGNNPPNFVNLDDGDTPLNQDDGNNFGDNNGDGNGNGGNGTDIPDDQKPQGLIDKITNGSAVPYIVGGGLLIALIALIAFLRARRGDGDDDDADELEELMKEEDALDKLNEAAKADPEKFNTNDPDELKDAFKETLKK